MPTPAGWPRRWRSCPRSARLAAALREMIMGPVITAATAGVAVLRPETIAQYGVSGPAARASGVDLDLRRQQPYLGYAELAELITLPESTAGDAQSRLAVLAEEMIISASLVDACVDRLRSLSGPTVGQTGQDHSAAGGRRLLSRSRHPSAWPESFSAPGARRLRGGYDCGHRRSATSPRWSRCWSASPSTHSRPRWPRWATSSATSTSKSGCSRIAPLTRRFPRSQRGRIFL